MTDHYVLVIDDDRTRLEQQRRRIVKWLSLSVQSGSTNFLEHCNRLAEIDRELKKMEVHRD